MEQINPLPNPSIIPRAPTISLINPPSSNKSVLIILLVVFVIVLISLNAYLFMKLQNPPQKPVASPAPIVQASPAPSPLDETANWKTYTNKDDGYLFRYRPDLLFELNPNHWQSGGLWFMSPDAKEQKGIPDSDKSWFDLQIIVESNPKGQTAREYLENYAQSLGDSDPPPGTRANRVINSFKNYKNGVIDGIVGDIDGWELPNNTVIFSKGDKIYRFTLWGGPNTGTKITKAAQSTFDQILSTFKFLE